MENDFHRGRSVDLGAISAVIMGAKDSITIPHTITGLKIILPGVCEDTKCLAERAFSLGVSDRHDRGRSHSPIAFSYLKEPMYIYNRFVLGRSGVGGPM
jgi:hypothetical protein